MTAVGAIIAADPTTVTITRHTKAPHAGGFSWNTATKAPITARIYQFSTRNMREVTLPEGEVKTIDHGLLVEPTADIVVGHDSWDSFVYDNRTYRIVGVRLYDDANVEMQMQADCVAV